MAPTPTSRHGGDELTNLALIALVALLTLSAVLRFAANVAAFLAGGEAPDGGPVAGLKVLTDPMRPGRAFGDANLNPFIYWLTVTVLVAAAAVVAWLVWRLVAGTRTPSAHTNATKGLATRTLRRRSSVSRWSR